MSRAQRVLFQCISANMKFYSLHLKNVLEGYPPAVTSCNGTSWIKMEFSADQYQSVAMRVHVSTEMTPNFVATQTECEVVPFVRIYDIFCRIGR